jgi:hypothetical protein
MEIYDLSGTANSRGLAILMGDSFDQEQYAFLNPDIESNPTSRRRRDAAQQWKGLRAWCGQALDSRATPFLEDATGPGFFLPGCSICVSENARVALLPHLADQVLFLPIDLVGAPQQYWVLYATEYSGELDMQRSQFRGAPSYVQDRRRELRRPVFLSNPLLDNLYIFRVPGNDDYVPFAQGDFATKRFFDLVVSLGLSGFGFRAIQGEQSSPAQTIVTTGPRYHLTS